MALKIRLARGGAKKRPFYQIVVADARSPRDGRFVEKVGTYNPMLPHDNQDRIRLKEDRIKHWLSVGAQPTERVALFLGNAKLIEMPVVRVTPIKSMPKAKAQERLKTEEETAKVKAEALAAPAPKVEEEVVVEAEEVEVVVEAPVEPEAAPKPEAAAEANTEVVPEIPGEAPVTEAPAADTENVPEIPGEASRETARDAETETVPDVKI